jgi:hypothetical protein
MRALAAGGGPFTPRQQVALLAYNERDVRALENRMMLEQLPDFNLPIGLDGRHRYENYAFGTITGRATPRAAGCLLLWPKWCRGLVRPSPGRALVSLDYAQQEYLISGVLSGDLGMVQDYRAGDVYMALVKSLGLIPPDGNKESHKQQRGLCKVVVLAASYGMGPESLARKIRRPITVAVDLLRRHRQRYAKFWRWSDATVRWARCHRWLRTRYGWAVFFPPGAKETTLRNWRTQATGGEVLRAAVCALDTAGFDVCATLHDSVLLECDGRNVDCIVETARSLMVRASEAVLGEPLRVDVHKVGPGERWLEDDKARATWARMMEMLHRVEGGGRDLFPAPAEERPAPALGVPLAPALGKS